MGRKRKQLDAGVVSSLPPCRVCGAPGAGLHYGVNTCEACKGFFHRSLKIWTQYRCIQTGNCSIEAGVVKLCQLCRYKKCLSVGMAKEAIKTGRYTSAKRTNDTLEIKQLQQERRISTESSDIHISQNQIQTDTFHTVVSEHSLDSNSQPDQLQSTNKHPVDQFSTACNVKFRSELSDTLALCGGRQLGTVSNIKQRTFTEVKTNKKRPQDCATNQKLQATSFRNTSVHGNECILSDVKQDFHQLQSQQHLRHSPLLSYTSSLTPLSVTSPEEVTVSPSPLVTEAGSLPLMSCSPETMEPLCLEYSIHTAASLASSLETSATSPTMCLLSPVSLAASPSVAHPATSSLLETDVQDCGSDCTSDQFGACAVGSYIDVVAAVYSNKDMIIRKLIEADENTLKPVFGQMTDEEIRQQHLDHLEACRLRTEMFGQLTKVPDQEYDYIFATTGLDTDNRQQKLNNMGACLETTIRSMVKFCKAIPGFSKLDIADRIKLIKYSRNEFYIFLTYKFIDPERKILRGFDFQWKCMNDLLTMQGDVENKVCEETLNMYFRFCESLQNLKLSREELVVIRALIVMSPDRDKPVDSPLAHEIHWQLSLCLIHTFSQRHINPMLMFARVMDRLTEARTQTESVLFFLKRLKIDKYSGLMYNPLLKEMFGGIFFNNGEDNWCEPA